MNSNSKNQWQPCDQGVIQEANGLVREGQLQQSRRMFLRNATTAVVATGVGFAAWSLFGPKDQLGDLYNNPNFPGGIACSEVKRLLPEYIGGSLQSNTTLVSSIVEHLSQCTHCCEKHDSMIQQFS